MGKGWQLDHFETNGLKTGFAPGKQPPVSEGEIRKLVVQQPMPLKDSRDQDKTVNIEDSQIKDLTIQESKNKDMAASDYVSFNKD